MAQVGAQVTQVFDTRDYANLLGERGKGNADVLQFRAVVIRLPRLLRQIRLNFIGSAVTAWRQLP